MSDAQTVAVPEFNLGLLTPEAWEEPKELIPVRVKTSRRRLSDEKYNAATEFRAALPRPVWQWEFNLECLDRVYVLPNGTTAPVILYAGIDLEKLDKKTQTIRGLQKGKSKEFLIITEWSKSVGPIVPDEERLEGLMFQVERYREKEISPKFFAKNVVLPKSPLPPTFVFAGETQRIPVTRQESIDDAEATSAQAAMGAQATASIPEAAAMIAEFVKGRDPATVTVKLMSDPQFPAAARREPFISALANGTIFDVLKENGVDLGV